MSKHYLWSHQSAWVHKVLMKGKITGAIKHTKPGNTTRNNLIAACACRFQRNKNLRWSWAAVCILFQENILILDHIFCFVMVSFLNKIILLRKKTDFEECSFPDEPSPTEEHCVLEQAQQDTTESVFQTETLSAGVHNDVYACLCVTVCVFIILLL